ncbi:hypothetical protein [Spiroplasma endosymbiont of Lonchoptera lutea]|uniref:hypothetical protein n=1 Tax=Spiroplasma endosymbiont of Lonchoptera lutea TaxID=3066297 RepID=UPI0030D5071A
MKKSLSILGTITIAGSGIAGLVGNAPATAKTEINSLQKSNLENLSRSKRTPQTYTQDTQWTQSQLCTKPTLTTFTAGGVAAGASIGSIVPGAGNLIGALVGGAIGIGTGLWAGENLCPLVPKN